jgi:hypothetical protein
MKMNEENTMRSPKSSLKHRAPFLLLVLLLSFQTASAFYDPGLQRWVTRDPAGEVSGANQCSILNNDPENRVDPSGLLGVGLYGHPSSSSLFSGPIFDLVDENMALTGKSDPSDEEFYEAYNAAADYESCWGSCMKSWNQAAAAALGIAGASSPYIRVPKDWLPESLTKPAVGDKALKDAKTSLLRTVSTAVKRACGADSWLGKQMGNLANQAKRGAAGRVSARLGVAGAAIGEAALAGYCANKCSSTPP